ARVVPTVRASPAHYSHVRVALVYTERRADLTEERARNYDRLRTGLEDVGASVAGCWYEEVDVDGADAVVLSGSSAPWSAHDPAALDRLGAALGGVPVLGICAGMQLQTRFAGGEIAPAAKPEHGLSPVDLHDRGDLLRGLDERIVVFHDHTYEVTRLPESFR